jgi:hypothetical protein
MKHVTTEIGVFVLFLVTFGEFVITKVSQVAGHLLGW